MVDDEMAAAVMAFAEAVNLAREGDRTVADPAGHPGPVTCTTAIRQKMIQASEAMERYSRARHQREAMDRHSRDRHEDEEKTDGKH